jgi:hypothetical protein
MNTDADYVDRVKAALAEAHKAAESAVLKEMSNKQKPLLGHWPQGFCAVVGHESNSGEFLAALKELGEINNEHFVDCPAISNFQEAAKSKTLKDQTAACAAAIAVMKKHFPNEYMVCRLR